MKKKLAALLCGVMCVGAFTGCSSTELAYLKMSKDLMDTMETCKVEGKMQADIDFDALQGFLVDVAKATDAEYYDEMYAEGMPSGKKTVTVDYDMNMDMEKLTYDMSFDLDYAGKNYDLGTMYYSMTEGIYVNTDTIWGAYQLAGDFAEGYEDSYIFSDAFAKDLKATLAEDKYVELLSPAYLTGVDLSEAVPQNGYGDLYDAVFTFYEDVLDGFETGMVTRTGGGYRIEADGQEVAQLLVDLLDFVADNPEQVMDATEAYMMAVMDSAVSATEEDKAMMQQAFTEMRASQQDFVAAAEQMSILLAEAVQEKSISMVLDSFSYDAKVTKAGNGFDSTASYDVTHKGKQVMNLTTDATLVKSDVSVTVPQTGVTVDELKEKLAVLENEKYNPVTGVSVSWGWYGENDYADLYTMRSVAEGAFFNNDYNWADLIVKENRAYLPLRAICDVLGEEVGWENATKTPYVLQGGQRIDMKGLLQDGRAFVAVRDFEKLGYTVEYNAFDDGFKTVDILK